MTEKRAASLLRRLRVRLATSAGGAAALLFGLWLRVEDAQAPTAPALIVPGQPLDPGRVELTPLSLTDPCTACTGRVTGAFADAGATAEPDRRKSGRHFLFSPIRPN